ncbi:RNA polymerase II transcription factor B subunit 2 [Smittium culicis]|uniref:RNA polymerase II transcription factor B subunit 2 n=1 Tax=Smittium culicis TaxID=133412 RepID=A0A1R1YKM7_9FUNG|nr:RNA polymerase II transcription factor B subunit 2 [Smittium culicis]
MSDNNSAENDNIQFQITILQFLEGLPEQLSNRLYIKPSSCLTVFSFFNESVECLKKLHILYEKNDSFKLNSSFQKQLINSLTGGGERQNFELVDNTCKTNIEDTYEIDTYANEKWESVLHFMVGTSAKKDHPNKSVLQLLKKSGLMTNFNGETQITSKGFQFLLQDICFQIWIILLQYLNMQEEEETDIVSVLGLFFQVGSLEFAQKYKVENLTELESKVFRDLMELGFIYKPNDSSRTYIPTRLVSILTGASNSSVKSTITMLNNRFDNKNNQNMLSNSTQYSEREVKDSGFIILETNYRLYAYTDCNVLDYARPSSSQRKSSSSAHYSVRPNPPMGTRKKSN